MQYTTLAIRVISQRPPGGRCTLYTGYAETMAECIGAHTEVAVDVISSTLRDAHGAGFPCLLMNGEAVQPADGVILMPTDIVEALARLGIDDETLCGLAEALQAPLERMLESTT